MKKRMCNFPGCTVLIDPSERYCLKHKKEKSSNSRKPFENAQRSNNNLYHTAQWKNLRKKVLKDNNYCVYCGSRENLVIDHIIPPRGNEDLFFSENNLQVVCHRCHSLKTAQEINHRRKRY
jgi:5-methylcytosine-specific restriction protein A